MIPLFHNHPEARPIERLIGEVGESDAGRPARPLLISMMVILCPPNQLQQVREYFDAGIVAEALQLDGTVVSTDRAFDRVEGLTRVW
jgi:hypothetical protein